LTNFDTAQFRIAGEEVMTPRWAWAGRKPVPLKTFVETIRSLLSHKRARELRSVKVPSMPDLDPLLTIAQNRALTLGYKPDTSSIQIME
jgi:hypothetical protein